MVPLSLLSGFPDVLILAGMVVFWVSMIVAIFHTPSAVFFARRPPETRRERVVVTWGLATLGSFLLAAVLAPPDPASLILWDLGGLVVTLPAAHLYVTYAARVRDAR